MVATRRRAPEPRLYELGVEVRPERTDEIVAWFVEHGATGLEERPRAQGVEVVLYGESRRVLEQLGRAAKEELAVDGPLGITVRATPAALAAWRSSVAEHLEPCRLTERLLAVPTTRPIPRLAHGERAIVLEPALAFGFGEHPTTRLAARAVEELCRRGSVADVLDVGAGTGVLAFVAVLSGARRAAGLDIDVAAVEAARRNAARNRLAHVCRFTMTPVSKVKKRFDLVVANIRLEPLASEAAAIGRAVIPGGFLLLTGILTGDRAELERRYAALGFRRLAVRSKKTDEGWALLSMLRVSASTRGR